MAMKFNSLLFSLISTVSIFFVEHTANSLAAYGQLPPLEPAVSTPVSIEGVPLKPGDRLRLTVVGFPEVSGEQTIMADGGLQIPLAGYVNVWGLTPNQAADEISVALEPYIRRPRVSLAIGSFSPTRVSVTGAVVKSGPLVLDTPAASLNGAGTLSEALSLAGGVMSNADLSNITIRRNVYTASNMSGSVAFASEKAADEIRVDLWQAIQEGDLAVDIPVYDGDEILVPVAQTTGLEQQILLSSSVAPVAIAINVGGEVNRPGIVEVPPSSNVSSAVAAAGGISPDGTAKNIVLLRTSPDGTIESSVYNLGEDSIVLNHGDSIIVSRSNRSEASQLLNIVSQVLSPFSLLFRAFD